VLLLKCRAMRTNSQNGVQYKQSDTS